MRVALLDILKEWCLREGFWVSETFSEGHLKMAKTDTQPAYLRMTSEGKFYIYPSMDKVDLNTSHPDFFDKLRKVILERTT